MAIKTCKDVSADVKEKFLSEAGEFFVCFFAVRVRVQKPCGVASKSG